MRPSRGLAAGWLALLGALLVAVPLLLRLLPAGLGTLFLIEFLSDGRVPALTTLTAPPHEETVRLASGPATLYRPLAPGRRPGLVLLHGLVPEGKDDPRLVWAAGLLARGGFAVLVPDLPGLRASRLRPADAEVVIRAVETLAAEPGVRADRTALVGISVGAGPALLAAADPRIADRIGLVATLGGYADARELVRYFTTGHYGFGEVRGRRVLDPELVRAFLRLNLDLIPDEEDRQALGALLEGRPLPHRLGPEGRAVAALLANRDPARVDALLEALPAAIRELLAELSPVSRLHRIRARLLLLHGRDDPAIPFTESLRLAAAAGPARTRLVLLSLIGHVDPAETSWWGVTAELFRLWGAAYELFRSRPLPRSSRGDDEAEGGTGRWESPGASLSR
ncbi:MAG: alpha/beta fold hydrolase [Candidatus Rokubacteria bacterium]|nr:alpha/beta fold hydrolase [Candidatus Rokubacteria bacterium]